MQLIKNLSKNAIKRKVWKVKGKQFSEEDKRKLFNMLKNSLKKKRGK